MKKLISSILSLALVLSATRISFADESSKMETNFSIKTNIPVQSMTKSPELTESEKLELKEEKAAKKAEEELKERLEDSYSYIIKENPCMKVAFKEVTKLLEKPDDSVITNKLEQLEDEKEALIDYKQKLLEKSDSKDESLSKQIKNIENRIQAIEYTEKCLTKCKARISNGNLGFAVAFLICIAAGPFVAAVLSSFR